MKDKSSQNTAYTSKTKFYQEHKITRIASLKGVLLEEIIEKSKSPLISKIKPSLKDNLQSVLRMC